MQPDFYICKHCGNIIYMVESGGAPVYCCGAPMSKLVANTTDASQEKHVPKIKREGNVLSAEIGSVFHPMTPEHYISWVAVLQRGKIKINKLSPNDPPIATFRVNPHADAKVFAYCNLHGLWMAESKGIPKT